MPRHMIDHDPSRGRRRAFTLIELLVVVAIVAVLAALLLPVLTQARESGRNAACISNLRQMGLAFALYADDYDDYLPSYDTWLWRTREHLASGDLYPFIRSVDVYVCPTDRYHGTRLWAGTRRTPRYFSYAINYACVVDERYRDAYGRPQRRRIVKFVQPAETMLLLEEDYTSPVNDGWVVPNGLDILATRHNGKGNLLMADHHVASMTAAQYEKVWKDAKSRFWWPY